MAIITIRRFLIISALLTLTACGGGGGGGGGSGTAPSSVAPQSSSAVVASSNSTVSTASSSSQSSSVNLSPTAKILFPRKDALTFPGYNNMTVSGVAYDDKGIRSVKVNGVAATLNGPSNVQSDDAKLTQSMTWSVFLTLPMGDNPISVDVTDTDGLEVKNVTKPLGIRNRYTPMGSVLDPLSDRMIGSISYGQFFSVDLSTLTSVPLSSPSFGNGIALNKDSSEIFSTRIVNGFLKLYSNKIGKNIESIVANYDLGYDPAKHSWIDSSAGVLSPDFKFYFSVVRYSFFEGNEDSFIIKVIKIDISSGTASVLTELDLKGSYLYVSNIFYMNNALLTVQPHYSVTGVTSELKRIDPETGEQADFMSLPQFELFASSEDEKTLYALSYDRFAIINLVNATVIEKDFPAQGIDVEFPQLSQLLVDQKRNRLLVSNSGVNDVIAIDIATAERNIIINNGIESGISFVWPYFMEVAADDKFAYVLDDRSNATDVLFKIDLETGDRTTVSDLSRYKNYGTYGLALDETNNRIFFAMGWTIGAIDLTTGLQTVIASPDVGLGTVMESLLSIGDMVYDSQSNRLLVSSGWQNGFVAEVDPVTLKRAVLFDSTIGSGPALFSISAMALDNENKKLYVANSDENYKTTILSINMETGERTFVFDECTDSNGTAKLVDSSSTTIMLDKKNQELYATSNNQILVKNLITDKCKIINSYVSDFALLSDSTLLGLSSGLVQIQPNTGERAIISK